MMSGHIYITWLSSSQMVDLVSPHFTLHFYFYFVLFLYFLFLEQLGLELGHKIQRMKKENPEQIMLHNMDTTCWPHVL